MTERNTHLTSPNLRVKNAESCFVIQDDYLPWPFSLKLAAKVDGFTESFSFDIASAYLRRTQQRNRKPPAQQRKVMNALLMAMCFYFDPVTYRVQRSVRELATECGLSRKTLTGGVVIDRAIRAITSLEKDYGFIVCVSPRKKNRQILKQAEVFLTPKFFDYLNIFPLALAEARIACRLTRSGGEDV